MYKTAHPVIGWAVSLGLTVYPKITKQSITTVGTMRLAYDFLLCEKKPLPKYGWKQVKE
ncbi:hypothetical protein [Paenibacillus donghaensis]|uniref:hypothetical protein n=1 Tax=Paenibacillus donghaensis TaxID=414771 RepID=UPI0012F8423E|nr:hypothetical protein [Paenibacillus donghaensis]